VYVSDLCGNGVQPIVAKAEMQSGYRVQPIILSVGYIDDKEHS